MCTVVLLRDVVPGYPLAVVANRDEYLDRPSEAAADRAGGYLAPRDSKRGGTWIGVNRHGVFAALTNRNGVIGKPGKISRGDLPTMALSEKTAADAYRRIRETYTTGKNFNGFYLLVADRGSAYLFGGDGLHLTHRPVSEAVLAVTNQGLGTVGDVGLPETPRRVTHLIKAWQSIDNLFRGYDKSQCQDCHLLSSSLLNHATRELRDNCPRCDGTGLVAYRWNSERHEREVITALKGLLAIHDEDRHGTCVNEPENNYGTKSSSIILLKPEPSDPQAQVEWLYAHRDRKDEGHVCDIPLTYHHWLGYDE